MQQSAMMQYNNNKERLPLLVLVSVVLLPIFTTTVTAFPTGAGSCPPNGPAVGQTHLSASKVVTGGLADGDIQFFVDEDRFRPERTYVVRVGKPTEVLVRAPFGGSGIKGFLIRLGQNTTNMESSRSSNSTTTTGYYDFTDSLTPVQIDQDINPYDQPEASAAKVETSFCADANAGGLTHTSSIAKYIIKGVLLVDTPLDDLVLDVTVVLENAADTSEFYYSQYQLQAIPPNAEPAPEAEPGQNVIVFGDSSLAALSLASSSSLVVMRMVATSLLVGVAAASIL